VRGTLGIVSTHAVERVVTGPLPEVASVPWRKRVTDRSLVVRKRWWTVTMVAHAVPFVCAGIGLMLLNPLAAPVSAILLAKAYIIPALYARRGANVARPKKRGSEDAERRALGLLGDLVGHDARDMVASTGLVLEPGRLGVWLVGEAGALLVRPGGHCVMCWCVRVPDHDLPSGDRIAHLLLALRADEQGFATVANMAFSGAPWRLRRKLEPEQRPAFAAAVKAAKAL
jgi:hypothetical protein